MLFHLAGVAGETLSDPVVPLAMPCAVAPINLSAQYKFAERESASVLLYLCLFSAVGMTSVVLLTP
jgi:small neutral amino acid transporter SnatA (MarC family)